MLLVAIDGHCLDSLFNQGLEFLILSDFLILSYLPHLLPVIIP